MPFIRPAMARIVFTLEDGVEIVSELDSDVITVGRHPDSIVELPSHSVSSHHATIKRRGDDFYVQDLGTTNGTKLNGVEVEEAKLDDGDKLTFGDVHGIVHLTEEVVTRNFVPSPDIIAPSAPPLPVITAGRRRPAVQRRANLGQYRESTGCASFLIFLLLMVIAFIVGLHVRHGVETGNFLFSDVLSKMTERAAKKLEEPPPPATPDAGKAAEPPGPPSTPSLPVVPK
jgi:hypothetical protein